MRLRKLRTSTTRMRDIDEHTGCLSAMLRWFVPYRAHDAAAALSSPPVRRVSPLPLGLGHRRAPPLVASACASSHHAHFHRTAFRIGAGSNTPTRARAVRAAERRHVAAATAAAATPIRCAAVRSSASRAPRSGCVVRTHMAPRCCSLTMGAAMNGRACDVTSPLCFVCRRRARPAPQACIHSGRHGAVHPPPPPCE